MAGLGVPSKPATTSTCLPSAGPRSEVGFSAFVTMQTNLIWWEGLRDAVSGARISNENAHKPQLAALLLRDKPCAPTVTGRSIRRPGSAWRRCRHNCMTGVARTADRRHAFQRVSRTGAQAVTGDTKPAPSWKDACRAIPARGPQRLSGWRLRRSAARAGARRQFRISYAPKCRKPRRLPGLSVQTDGSRSEVTLDAQTARPNAIGLDGRTRRSGVTDLTGDIVVLDFSTKLETGDRTPD